MISAKQRKADNDNNSVVSANDIESVSSGSSNEQHAEVKHVVNHPVEHKVQPAPVVVAVPAEEVNDADVVLIEHKHEGNNDNENKHGQPLENNEQANDNNNNNNNNINYNEQKHQEEKDANKDSITHTLVIDPAHPHLTGEHCFLFSQLVYLSYPSLTAFVFCAIIPQN